MSKKGALLRECPLILTLKGWYKMNKWSKIKITVVKMFVSDDIIAEFAADKGLGICGAFEVGQEYILESPKIPDGFCSWAWGDIHRDVIAVMGGGSFPWIEKEGLNFASCTDGLRPVVFRIERI